MVAASTISFGLRTAAEQAALVGCFGRWLNSLDAPVQILVRAYAVDLTELIGQIAEAAPALPHRSLEQAALDHAAYLAELSASRDLLARQVLIVIRDTLRQRDASAAVVIRRAEHAERALAALGVAARVLDADAVCAVLADCLAPGSAHSPDQTAPGQVITGEAPP